MELGRQCEHKRDQLMQDLYDVSGTVATEAVRGHVQSADGSCSPLILT